MKSLSIIFITSRDEPHFDWFLDSLGNQMDDSMRTDIIIVDLLKDERKRDLKCFPPLIRHVHPKPTVWQGPHRLTKEDWWAISSARNTGICLCQTDFICFVDDSCVLMPGFIKAIQRAMKEEYAVAGSYEKRCGMKVESGKIVEPGEVIGLDPRNPGHRRFEPIMTYGGDYFGCLTALPLEWCLEMNGWSEDCDGLGLEDVVFGNMLVRNGHITKFDPSFQIIEDRPRDSGWGMPKRTDKGVSPRDKSHALLERHNGKKRCTDYQIDLRTEREKVLAGGKWSAPNGASHDWWDGQPLGEMTVR